jgi:hypothetical protein
MKLLLNLLFCFSLLFSQNLKPTQTYLASGSVTALSLKDSLLYISTDASKIDIFDTITAKLIKNITIPKIKDFAGDEINSKIYSIDLINEKILFVSQGQKGFRTIFQYKNDKLTKIISTKKKLSISKALYIDKDIIIFSTLSNQLFLYNLKEEKFLWEIQVSQSKFSDFRLNEEKTKVIIADESGSLSQINVKTGEISKIFSGLNVDNIFQIDVKNDIIITAGQDRRCGIYEKFDQYYKEADFLIYSVGLSPSGNIAGYANNEENDITIFNTKTKKELYTLKGHKMTLSNILFKNENELFSSSDTNEVYYWQLKN